MKKTIKLIAVAALCFHFSLNVTAQLPLKIGDKVPDVAINNISNYKTSSAKLSDFEGKLLILDFWATWCSACLKNFPLLDSLQRKYPDQLQVLLVNDINTGDSPKKITELFEKKAQTTGKAYALPYLVGDDQLTRLFPHRLLPHYVWIGADRRVKAITSSAELNPGNIQQMINEQPVGLSYKKDYDTKKLLFLSEDTPAKIVQYAVFLKGRVEGLSSGNIYRRDGTVLYGRALTNTTLYGMYQAMAIALLKSYNKKMVLIEEPGLKHLIPGSADLKDQKWMKENLHTLEVVVPVSQSEKLYTFMLDQLNAFSGYEGRLETRRVKCLVLTTSPRKPPVHSAGAKPVVISFDAGVFKLVNRPLSSLVNSLNNVDDIPLPIVDESNFTANTDITLSGSADLRVIKKELHAQGLEINEAEREITFFVISDKTNKFHVETQEN